MEENKIIKHQCPSCGSNLTVDTETQMYRCSFCGSTYDYEYFREEQMHELAATYLARKENRAAIDAYHFILNKDPHDFLALRGLMLAAGDLRNIDNLAKDDLRKDFSYDSRLVSEAEAGASEEDKGYFGELTGIYKDLKENSDLNHEIKNLRKERRVVEDTIAISEKEKRVCYFKDKSGNEYHPMFVFVLFWIFVALITIGGILLLINFHDTADVIDACVFILIADIIITVLNLKIAYPKIRELNAKEAKIGELYVKSGNIGGKVREHYDKTDKLKVKLDASIPGFIAKDKERTAEEAK